MMVTRVTAGALSSIEDVERFYTRLASASRNGSGDALELDLGLTTFVSPGGVLAIIGVARYWHRMTGWRTILTNIPLDVHQYLERIDLFTECAGWIEPSRALASDQRYARSVASSNLLEVMPIASDENENEACVSYAVDRANRILKGWFGYRSVSVGRLLTVLSEIATNIIHSYDQGFALIQRYRDPTNRAAGSRVVVAVADLGIGIEASLRAKGIGVATDSGSDYILRALELGVTSQNTVAGLGLHRVKHIVEDWNGSLHIRSNRACVHCESNQVQVENGLALLPGTQVTITVRGD